MTPKRNFISYLWLVVKGIAMGTANKIPGVSGGAVAFIVGFYEEFIFSLRRFNKKALLLLLHGRFSKFAQYTNLKFLAAIFAGTVTSFFTISLALDFFIRYYPSQVWGAFFGMVVASVYYLIKDFRGWRVKTVAILIAGAAAGFGMTLISYGEGISSPLAVFASGWISVCGMTLPGLSGSFLLMLIGNYKLLLVDSVNALYYTITGVFQGDWSVFDNAHNIQLIKVNIIFTLGSITGLISLSHILGWLLKRYRDMVLATIIGFITGSLGVMWPWRHDIYMSDAAGKIATDNTGSPILAGIDQYMPDFALWGTWTAILWIILGAVMVYFLENYSRRLKKKKDAAGNASPDPTDQNTPS